MKNKLHYVIKRQEYTKRYDVRYIAEIKHLGLGKFKILKDAESYILKNKINAQFKAWDDQWAKQELKRIRDENREFSHSVASEKTLEAQENYNDLDNLLMYSLELDPSLNWASLEDNTKFDEPHPKENLDNEMRSIRKPSSPTFLAKPKEPNDDDFKPMLGFLDKLISSQKRKKVEAATAAYQHAMAGWLSLCKDVDNQNREITEVFQKETDRYNAKIRELRIKYNLLEEEWEKSEREYYKKQHENNLNISTLRQRYLAKDERTISWYCEMVLNKSVYPEYFPRNFELDFSNETGMVVIEYALPSLDIMPSLKAVKYIATKNELIEIHITEAQKAKIYDEVVYKIVLRTIYELFKSDKINALDAIVFNGWVESVNKATGKLVNNCIVSLKANKKEFEEIDLSRVDPKICFKNLKGVGSSKLSSLVAIRPILEIDKSDKRFVNSYEVATTMEGENLATMSWEDFEHLIRELFEKEFSANGGEVKVTQASRDGGVDAVAFDPDPIRGGKIVIQAKRYTNTVGVSAVRDLYGTVLNEGATKGILVTTADYGPDAYTFAQNKPLALMNGANLLYLLEKHGHRSRIDITEAKRILKENDFR